MQLSLLPSKPDDTPTFVIGANEHTYAGQPIVSNASCKLKWIGSSGSCSWWSIWIEKGLMTTIHPYTSSQPILDAKR